MTTTETAPTATPTLTDLAVAALNTSTTVDGHVILLTARLNPGGDITLTAERHQLTDLPGGDIAVTTTETMQLFPSPVDPTTPTPAPVAQAPELDTTHAAVDLAPTQPWVPAVAGNGDGTAPPLDAA